MTSSKPLRVGIISANWGVCAHLPAWRSLKGVEVTSICTSRPETAAAAAQDYGFARAFHDFRVMAADPDIDIVDCGTRPPLRYDMVMAALDAGKHVYQGIPFATDLASARALTVRREKSGRVAAVDAFMQAIPALVQLKNLIDEDAIGRVHGVRATMDLSLFTEQVVNVPSYTWFADPANGASVMRNNGSHVLHLLVHMFGRVSEVISEQSIQLRRWPNADGPEIEPQVPDTAHSMVRFESGLLGQLSLVWSMPDCPGFRLEVWGSRGRLVATAPVFPQSFDTRLYRSGFGGLGVRDEAEVTIPANLYGLPRSTAKADDPRPGVFPMASVFSSMLDEIEGYGRAQPDFAQALHVQAIVEAAATSSSERRWVAVEA